MRGGRFFESNFDEISKTSVPEIRMMPTPPFPDGVAIAAIVSFFNTLFRVFDLFGDVGLLQNRQGIIHNPVPHQTRWEE